MTKLHYEEHFYCFYSKKYSNIENRGTPFKRYNDVLEILRKDLVSG
jgi:hypothetical protein